jgi:hypothetical protein
LNHYRNQIRHTDQSLWGKSVNTSTMMNHFPTNPYSVNNQP